MGWNINTTLEDSVFENYRDLLNLSQKLKTMEISDEILFVEMAFNLTKL